MHGWCPWPPPAVASGVAHLRLGPPTPRALTRGASAPGGASGPGRDVSRAGGLGHDLDPGGSFVGQRDIDRPGATVCRWPDSRGRVKDDGPSASARNGTSEVLTLGLDEPVEARELFATCDPGACRL